MDNILIIETASSSPFIFLKQKDKEVYLSLDPGFDLSKNIHLSLKKILLDLEGLKAIGIGMGPGSFTGLRVGVTIAQTLSFISQIPLIPFCSPLAFVPEGASNYSVLFDARSQGLYIFNDCKEKPYRTPLNQAISLLQKKKNIYTPDENLIKKLAEFPLPLTKVSPCTSSLLRYLKTNLSKKPYTNLPVIYPNHLLPSKKRQDSYED